MGIAIKGFILCAVGLAAYYLVGRNMGRKAGLLVAVGAAGVVALLFQSC
jgi:hypothetical protein